MAQYNTVEIKEDIVSRNNAGADAVRSELRSKGVFFLNVMASPGSGKTTLLLNLIDRLKDDYRIGVIEADIDAAVDAARIAEETGVRTLQMHTGGACHITYQMAREALDALGTQDLDLIFLENVGNLVCPAEFDTGASANLVLLSVPEGDDKPLKYPLMFEEADMVAITKTDTQPAFDFDRTRAIENIRRRNKDAAVTFVSARTGEGMEELAAQIQKRAQVVCSPA